MAAQEGQFETARLLLQHGAPVGAVDRAGWSAFHYAANHRWATWRGDIGGQLGVLELLVQHGADVDASDGEGYTCVHSAAQSGKVEMIKVLRRLGAKPDATTVRGVAPVHVAAEGGRAAVVEELLDWCPDVVECEDFRGHRPLHHAAYHGHADVVEALLRRGAEACPGPDASGRERRASLDNPAMATTTRRTQTQCATPLHLAARSGSLDVVVVLLAGGADPTVTDSRGWTPRRLARECAERENTGRERVSGSDKRSGEDAAVTKAKARLAVDAVLERAEAGTPLLWSRQVHRLYPTQFKRDTQELLMTCAGITKHIRGLAADAVHDEVLRAGAQNVWPSEISQKTWSAVERVRAACEMRWRSMEAQNGRLARGVGLGMGLEFGGIEPFYSNGRLGRYGQFEDQNVGCTAETGGGIDDVAVNVRVNSGQRYDMANAPAPGTPPGSAGGRGAADGSVDDQEMDVESYASEDEDEVQSAPPTAAQQQEHQRLANEHQQQQRAAATQHAAMQRELYAMYETQMHFAAALAAQ